MGKIKVRLISVVIALFMAWSMEGMAVTMEDKGEIPEFLQEDKNVIAFNGADWSPLFDQMVALQSEDEELSQVVSIVHIGDSHLQAGFLTDAVRRPLQRDFGDAGRGLIVPLKMAETNEPTDYSIEASGEWDFARCMGKTKDKYKLGVSGIAVVSTTGDIDMTFSTLDKGDGCAGFSILRLFHAPVETFPGFVDAPFCAAGEFCHPFLTQFSWDEPVCSAHLLGFDAGEDEPLAIYGASLETGEAGILYHTIGNNGAFYNTYAGIPRFAEQVAALTPQLIIISLGTNESFSTNLTHKVLYQQIDKVVSALRRKSPHSLILLTTPAECARRGAAKGVMVGETIKAYAQDHELAYWDWYEVAGGEGSSAHWCAGGYMAKDRIHCSVSGYRLQGEMLYRTLMKAYQEYVDGMDK